MARLSAVETFEFSNSPGLYAYGFEFSRTTRFMARGAYWYFVAGGPATLSAILYDAASQEPLAGGTITTSGWTPETWHEIAFDLPYIGEAGAGYVVAVEASGESAYSNSADYPVVHDGFTIVQDRYESGGGWPNTTWTSGAHSVGLWYDNTDAEWIFNSLEPSNNDADEGQPVDTGTTFVTDEVGAVPHVRYRAPVTIGAGDTYTFRLYELATNSTGTLLASATALGSDLFPNQWNLIPLASLAYLDTTHAYRVAAHAPNGRLVATSGTFNNPVDNGSHLTAIQDNTDPFGGGNLLRNGTYADSATPVLPAGQFLASNYFVDVVFLPGLTSPGPAGTLRVRQGGILRATTLAGATRLGGTPFPFGP